jgi:type IV secretory pathway TraG/TraD family ATPase VirD4
MCPDGINGFVFGLGSPADVADWLYTRYPTAHLVEYSALGLSAAGSMWFGWDSGGPMGDEIHISGPQYWFDTNKARAAAQGNELMLVKESGKGISIAGVTISRDRETKHILVVGRTGGGKTVAIAPMIQQVVTRMSVKKDGTQGHDKLIIFDNKGDFSRWVTCADGTAPTILAPWDARSPAWDVARDCSTRAEAAELAARFIPESGSDPMWSAGARQILTGFMVKLQSELLDKWTWGDLADLLAVPLDDVYGIMEQYHPEALRAVEKAEGASKSKGGSTSKTTQSLMITLSAQMSAVYRMAEAWENSTDKWSVSDFLAGFRMEDDGTKKPMPQCVILQGNATYSEMQKSYIQGVIAMLAARVNSPAYVESKPSEPGLWLFLDEVPQIGELPWLKPFLEIGRSKGMRCVLGMQDVSQMYEIYGKEAAEAILNIPQGFIFAGLGGESSPSWAANMIGKRRVARHRRSGTTKTDGSTDYTMNYSEEEDYCVKPNQFTSGLGRTIGGVRSIFWPGSDDAYRLLFPFPNTRDVRESMVPARWTLSTWKLREMDFEEQINAIARANSAIASPVPINVAEPAEIANTNTQPRNPFIDQLDDALEDDDMGGGDADTGAERGPENDQEEPAMGGGNTPTPSPSISSSSRRSGPGLTVYGNVAHQQNQQDQQDQQDQQAQEIESDDSMEAPLDSFREMATEGLGDVSPIGGDMLSILDMLGKVIDSVESAQPKPEPSQNNEYIAVNE